MHVFDESRWRFESGDEWPVVLQWDTDPTYVGSLQRLQSSELGEGTRAVDFVAVGPQQRPFLIEVKNVIGHAAFESINDRAFQIAAKVRDSLCGVAFAKAQPGDIPDPGLAAVRQRLRQTNQLRVLVIVEYQDAPLQTIALRKKLESLLIWLRGELAVADSSADIQGLTISVAAGGDSD